MTFCRTSLVAAVALACCACGDDGAQTAANDIAAPPSDDIAVAPIDDLARVYDMGRDWSFSFADAAGFCDSTGDAGSNIAGTCVQTFFAKFAECWIPAGMCSVVQTSNSDETWCWETGSGVLQDAPIFHGVEQRTYVHGETLCMTWTRGDAGADGVWTAPDGTRLSLVVATGDVICPDGSHVTIGPNDGNCDELARLLYPERYDKCGAFEPLVSCPPSFPHY